MSHRRRFVGVLPANQANQLLVRSLFKRQRLQLKPLLKHPSRNLLHQPRPNLQQKRVSDRLLLKLSHLLLKSKSQRNQHVQPKRPLPRLRKRSPPPRILFQKLQQLQSRLRRRPEVPQRSRKKSQNLLRRKLSSQLQRSRPQLWWRRRSLNQSLRRDLLAVRV